MSRTVSLLNVDISVLIVESNSDFVEETTLEMSLLRSDVSVLNDENVREERSLISEEVVALCILLFSRDNSLEVYDDKSLISLAKATALHH